MTITIVVCAHNEERFIASCLHSLLAQNRRPDEVLVINNASSDRTSEVAAAIPGVRVIDEPRKGLVVDRIGGFDTSIEFHGEDTNLGRRLSQIGNVDLRYDCYLYTSARRYNAMGKGAVFRLYVRNFVSELLHHRPKDRVHLDIRH